MGKKNLDVSSMARLRLMWTPRPMGVDQHPSTMLCKHHITFVLQSHYYWEVISLFTVVRGELPLPDQFTGRKHQPWAGGVSKLYFLEFQHLIVTWIPHFVVDFPRAIHYSRCISRSMTTSLSSVFRMIAGHTLIRWRHTGVSHHVMFYLNFINNSSFVTILWP